MRTRYRMRVLAVAVLIPLMVLLTGCIKLTAEFDIKSEQDITIVMDFAVQKSAIEASGMAADEFGRPEGFCVPSQDEQQARTTPYSDDTWIGCRSEAKGQADSDGLSLKDNIWTFDLTPSAVGTPSVGTQGLDASSFDEFRVSVSFPGKVLSHSGSSTVKGNTVTWTDANDLLTGEGLKATAENRGNFPLWAVLAITAGVVALGVGAAFVVARRRTRARAAAQGHVYPQAGFAGQQEHGQVPFDQPNGAFQPYPPPPQPYPPHPYPQDPGPEDPGPGGGRPSN